MFLQGHYEQAKHYLSQALTKAQKTGHQAGTALAARNLCSLAIRQGDYEIDREYAEQYAAIFMSLGDQAEIAGSLNSLAMVSAIEGSYIAAKGRKPHVSIA